MRRIDTLAAVSGFLALLLFPSLAPAQTAEGVGVVSTISGQATISRTSLPQPQPLQFKDSVFNKDRISTAENSTVKVLMGGKALVTVRELSILTITEEMGRSTVDLQSGKIALGVIRQRMKPGESIEVRTHNAVAAVRGTVIVVEIVRASAEATGGPTALTTNVHVLNGSAVVHATNILGAPSVTIGPMNTYSQIGNVVGSIRPLTPAGVTQLLGNLRATPQLSHSSGGAMDQILGQQQAKVTTKFGTGAGAADSLGIGSLMPGGNLTPTVQTQAPITPPRPTPPPGCGPPPCGKPKG